MIIVLIPIGDKITDASNTTVPPFKIEGKIEFLLEISENKGVIFPKVPAP